VKQSLSVTALLDHVLHVVQLGAQKKMVRADTCSRIATVQHVQMVRVPIDQFPCNAVRELARTIEVEDAVAIFRAASLPEPTVLTEFDLIPEPGDSRKTRARSKENFQQFIRAYPGKGCDFLEASGVDPWIIAGPG
jgi:hypothetical protein